MNGTIYRVRPRPPRAYRRLKSTLTLARDLVILFSALAVIGIGTFTLVVGWIAQ